MIISPESFFILKKHFKFDRIFDLLSYDMNMDLLQTELHALKKESYDNNYRFIFLHYDTEYYINKTIPGLTLLNLQRILVSLDIPNYFCLIITQQDLTDYLEYLRIHETTDSIPIHSIKSLTHYPLFSKIDKKLQLSIESIDKKFISLNGVPRFHRRLLVGGLQERKLLDDGIVSFNKKYKP
jgi:hypothetical protein